MNKAQLIRDLLHSYVLITEKHTSEFKAQFLTQKEIKKQMERKKQQKTSVQERQSISTGLGSKTCLYKQPIYFPRARRHTSNFNARYRCRAGRCLFKMQSHFFPYQKYLYKEKHAVLLMMKALFSWEAINPSHTLKIQLCQRT